MKKILKALSTFIQGQEESFKRHNAQYEAPGKFEQDRDAGYKNIQEDRINWPDFGIRDLLAKHPNVKTAVDIGSGTGWVAASVHSLGLNVIALEPSAAAIDISKRAYPAESYPNITWHQGFAEELLPTLRLTEPAIFITGCVLSHLRDKEVEKICRAICAVAPAGSVLAFSECWSEKKPWHQRMWHIRSKAWWQSQFPEWTLTFGGTKHDQGDYYMGIWGEKSAGNFSKE
ncbi:class I SAM-dependent methyltransferase [Patescibacteria group bacterium]|nr:class I SAM-dependent methyltransferase [Patescibacteria group bacterium]